MKWTAIKEYETDLCKIAHKYNTDKCPQVNHPYTPFYSELFDKRKDEIKKVVELGIGNARHMAKMARRHGEYPVGASLRMWRDYFKNAQIYGADCFPETMFSDERIETIVCDETKTEDLKELIKKVGRDIDIFVDDALHTHEAQIFACKHVLPLLGTDTIYIIEDVKEVQDLAEKLHNEIDDKYYHIQTVEFDRYYEKTGETVTHGEGLIVIRTKPLDHLFIREIINE